MVSGISSIPRHSSVQTMPTLPQRDEAMRGSFSTVGVGKDHRSMQDFKNHSQWERPTPTAIFATESGGYSAATDPIPVGRPHRKKITETFTKTKVVSGRMRPQNVAPASKELGAIPHGHSIATPLRPQHTVWCQN